jgi:MinD superfamily P-loop ATPase
MIITIASGKGGTGKTMVSTGLALYLNEVFEGSIAFIDCDVEEPNAHIFLKPHVVKKSSFGIPVPEIEHSKCDCCGTCQEVCAYHALVVLKDTVLTFPELCHGCGACSLLCPRGAIREKERSCGVVEEGTCGRISFFQGRLNIGEPMASPLIREVKNYWRNNWLPVNKQDAVTLIDAPPGTSCPVIETVKGSDFVLLVTEPTPFGVHDLKLTVQMLERLKIPYAVIVNRSDLGDREVFDFCKKNSIPIIVEIPYERNIAVLYSYGISLIKEGEQYKRYFRDIWKYLESTVSDPIHT